MLRKTGLLGILGLLVAAAPRHAEDTFTIKLKEGDKGAVTQHKIEETEDSHVKVEGPDGKVFNVENKSKTTIEEYKETILAKEKGKRATKLRREYSKAILKADDKEKTLPYDGKTLLIEKKGDKYHFTIEGGEEVKGEDAEFLDDTFNKRPDDCDNAPENVFLPKKPVAVNDTWKINRELVKALAKSAKLHLLVDPSKSTGTGKLLRSYRKNGGQYGIFNIEAKLPLGEDLSLGQKVKAPIREGSILVHKKLDTYIDGTSSDAVSE